MIGTVAAGSAGSPAMRTAFLVLMGVVVIAGLTLLIDHRVGKYYEFVFTPHQPGRSA